MTHKSQLLGDLRNEKYTYFTDLAGMKLISKYNKGFSLLLSAIDIFSKYACFVPFKDKKGIKITNNFQNNFWWV